MPQPWSTGLFDCFDDKSICMVGLCCPCYLFGQNAEMIDGSNKFMMCCAYCCLSELCLSFVVHKPRRQALRAAYNLVEEPSDMVATCLRSGYAICQEAREMKLRGVQPGGRISTVTSQPR